MRVFFLVTAFFEGVTGVLLLLAPGVVLALLFAWREIGPETVLLARLAGAGVLALGVASGLARDAGVAPATRGLLAGLLVYHVLAIALLGFGGAVLGMAGLFLWPAVLYHVALTAWSLACLRHRGARASG